MSWRSEHRLARALVVAFFVLMLLRRDAQVSGADAASGASSASTSGCQVCSATGDCSRAYLSTPGNYCGPWLDHLNRKQSCCCPTTASCKLSNYSCRCSSIPTTSTKSSGVGSSGWVGVAIGVAVLLSCCIGVCWCFFNVIKRAARSPSPPQQIAFAQLVEYAASPVPVQAAALSPYNVAPMYPHPTVPVYNYGYDYYGGAGAHRHHHHHHSSGLSTGLGTVAGLAAGMIMVDAIAGAGHHHHGFGGGYDGGSGYDGGRGGLGGGGDFGGDF